MDIQDVDVVTILGSGQGGGLELLPHSLPGLTILSEYTPLRVEEFVRQCVVAHMCTGDIRIHNNVINSPQEVLPIISALATREARSVLFTVNETLQPEKLAEALGCLHKLVYFNCEFQKCFQNTKQSVTLALITQVELHKSTVCHHHISACQYSYSGSTPGAQCLDVIHQPRFCTMHVKYVLQSFEI